MYDCIVIFSEMDILEHPQYFSLSFPIPLFPAYTMCGNTPGNYSIDNVELCIEKIIIEESLAAF